MISGDRDSGREMPEARERIAEGQERETGEKGVEAADAGDLRRVPI